MGRKKPRQKAAKKKTTATPQTKPIDETQVLTQKWATKFKQVVKSYETKQYKKGLKDAETILKHNPVHGETLAMKGLILNCLDRKEEGTQCIRNGLKKNIKSHVCWHVYGLLHRANHDYETAVKGYLNALRIDTGNLQIMKDLSLLQIQIRNLEGFQETRRKILTVKSNNRNNWIAYAIGSQLVGQLKKCETILESYENTLDEVKDRDYEHSEMLLYKNEIIEQQGDLNRVIEHMNTIERNICDKLSFMERKARILLKLNELSQAQTIYDRLLNINPDNLAYHKGSCACRGHGLELKEDDSHTPEQVEALTKYYEQLREKYPRSLACQRIPLDFLQGNNFKDYTDGYIRQRIRRGVPSLFRDLKPLYKNPEKVVSVESLITQFETNLRSNLKFSEADEDSESPACLLWTLYLSAQHYNHLAQPQKALDRVNEAIEHTPTVNDLYLLKGRIYKHAGDYMQAFKLVDEARRMDTADRYLNTKCVRYAFRANLIEDAERIVALFLRETDSLTSLHDMQCMWYEIAAGRNYMKQENYGKALKTFHQINKHFDDIIEDQFDFHTYCLRKMTLRAYLDMLALEDTIRSHRRFGAAAKYIVQCYLILHNRKLEGNEKEQIQEEVVDENDHEKARERARKRRAANKAKAKAQKKASASKLKNEEKKTPVKNIRGEVIHDDDQDGSKFLEADDFLEPPTVFIRQLQEFCADDIESHLLACQLYLKKEKYLLVLKSLKKAKEIDATHPQLYARMVEFFLAVDKNTDRINTTIQEVISLERAELQPLPLEEYHENFIKTCSSQPSRMAAARGLHMLKPEDKQSILEVATNLDGSTHLACENVYRFIKDDVNDLDAAEIYKAACHERFPLAVYFQPQKQTPETEANVEQKNASEDNGGEAQVD